MRHDNINTSGGGEYYLKNLRIAAARAGISLGLRPLALAGEGRLQRAREGARAAVHVDCVRTRRTRLSCCRLHRTTVAASVLVDRIVRSGDGICVGYLVTITLVPSYHVDA